MSTLKVNKLRDTAGSADSITLDPNGGAVIAGVTTVSTIKVGSGVTISSDGDVFHTGVCTATSFVGNAASLTQIPAANIVGVCTSGLTKTGGFGKFASYALIGDQKATNGTGGSTSTGTFNVRDINTEFADADGIVSISSNQFTLQAGTYLLKASAPAYKAQRHQIIIWNVTDSSVAVVGTSEYNDNSTGIQTRSFATGRVTIGSAKAFEIRHRVYIAAVSYTHLTLPTR